jgi:hypothetical protein
MSRKQAGRLMTVLPSGVIGYVRLQEKPTLAQLQREVGGLIERVRVRFEGRVRDAFVNEDGLGLGLARNQAATDLLAPPFNPRINVLVGNLVVWVPDPKEKVK